MKILLARPQINPDSHGEMLKLPPLTLLQIAALTPPEYEVSIIDESFEKIGFNEDYDLVALSFRTLNAPRAYEIADEFRKQGVTVVCGGWHPSALPEEAKQHADAVVIGEAEGAWPQLLTDFKKGKLKPFYKAKLVDPSLIPEPRRNIFRYTHVIETVQISRGCPYKCEFCSISNMINGNIYRARPIENVIREIKNIKNKFLVFVDPSLTINIKHTKNLFKNMRNLNKKFACFGNTNLADDEKFLKLASEAGCLGWSIGFESISQKSIEDIGKKTNKVRDYKRIIRKVHDHNMAVLGSFVFGFDSDTINTFDATLDTIYDLELDTVGINILTPFPGTPLYTRLEKEGRILTRDWSKYGMRDVVFKPKNMTPEELLDGVKKIAGEFYSHKSLFKVALNSIKLGFYPSLAVGLWRYGQRMDYKNRWNWI